MSLTLTEQLNLLNIGNIGSYSLSELLHQGATNYAIGFYNSAKDFPTSDGGGLPINTEAYSYKNSMAGACNQIIRSEMTRDSAAIKILTRIFVSIVGLSTYTYTNVSSATEPQWLDFISDNVEEVIENFAGILETEKVKYDAL